MMSDQNSGQEPQIDFGFHIVLPRIIRTGYKHVTIHQKWLCLCLKDLCGERGACWRSIRALAKETGLSLGTISEGIPILHEAGLIHAEKRSTKERGEFWYITIVDIWQLNGKIHPTKRRSSDEPLPPKGVHLTNRGCSSSEPGCSSGEREEERREEESIGEEGGKENDRQESQKERFSSLPPSIHSHSHKNENPPEKGESEEEQAERQRKAVLLRDAWQSRFPGGVAFGERSWEHARKHGVALCAWSETLGVSLVDVLNDIETYARRREEKQGRSWYKENGFGIWNIGDVIESWSSVIRDRLQKKQSREKQTPRDTNIPIPTSELPRNGDYIDYTHAFDHLPGDYDDGPSFAERKAKRLAEAAARAAANTAIAG